MARQTYRKIERIVAAWSLLDLRQGEAMTMTKAIKWKRRSTTSGDLIAAFCDAAFQICRNEQPAYQVAAVALEDLLRSRRTKRPPVW
jgi:hypothetical protein